MSEPLPIEGRIDFSRSDEGTHIEIRLILPNGKVVNKEHAGSHTLTDAELRKALRICINWAIRKLNEGNHAD